MKSSLERRYDLDWLRVLGVLMRANRKNCISQLPAASLPATVVQTRLD